MSGHVHLLYSDTMLGPTLQRQLQSSYFHVTGGSAEALDDAIADIRANKPEVIALIREPETDLNRLRALKHAFPNQSLVLVDPIPSPHSQEHALELGADMYLALPASRQRVTARLSAQVRRARRLDDAGSTEDVLRVLGFEPELFAVQDAASQASPVLVCHEDDAFARAIQRCLTQAGLVAEVAPLAQSGVLVEHACLVLGAVSDKGWDAAFALTARTRSHAAHRNTPITLASAHLPDRIIETMERMDVQDAWSGSAPDLSLSLMVREQVRISEQFKQRRGALAQSLDLAITDGLTDLYNRRYLAAHFPVQMQIARQSQRPLSLALFDLDGFKALNDAYGHPAGDQFLIGVAAHFNRSSRASDSAVRLGGDEFALVLPNADGAAARTVVQRLIADVADLRHAGSDQGLIKISASAGLVTLPVGDWASTADALIARADARLYAAKEKGGNQIVDTAPS